MGAYWYWMMGLSIASSAIAGIVGSRKEAGFEGTILGFLLGPFGIVMVCFFDHRPVCSKCGVKLSQRPASCPQCATEFQWVGRCCLPKPQKKSV